MMASWSLAETIGNWRNPIVVENHNKKKRKMYKMERKIKQKLAGIFFIILGIIPMFFGEGTMALFFVPLGLGMFFTKENCM